MGKMGDGYGSECHLLRWMGRHRSAFDRAVLRALQSGGSVGWLDFPFKPGAPWHDAEWTGLDFLADNAQLQHAWKAFWPSGAGIHNWDAVGRLSAEDSPAEWVLVEAKAHLGEIKSTCGAKPSGGRTKIERALAETKDVLGVAADQDWMNGCYQSANRLAALHFLMSQRIPARLLFIYFVGDRSNSRRRCPRTVEQWQPALREQQQRLGLPAGHALDGRVHTLFLHVSEE